MLPACTLPSMSVNPAAGPGRRPKSPNQECGHLSAGDHIMGTEPAGVASTAPHRPHISQQLHIRAHHTSGPTSEDRLATGSGINPRARITHTAIAHRHKSSPEQRNRPPLHPEPSNTPTSPRASNATSPALSPASLNPPINAPTATARTAITTATNRPPISHPRGLTASLPAELTTPVSQDLVVGGLS